MMITRRTLLKLSVSAPLVSVVPVLAETDLIAVADIKSAMQNSALIYLTPLKSNGSESRCQAEVWFVYDGLDMYVCTAAESWRAQAPGRGLDQARVWVGDLGPWKRTKHKYKQLPRIEAQASVISDDSMTERVLQLFGDKYSMEWIVWGSRFRSGLADGSRSMLRYRPLSV